MELLRLLVWDPRNELVMRPFVWSMRIGFVAIFALLLDWRVFACLYVFAGLITWNMAHSIDRYATAPCPRIMLTPLVVIAWPIMVLRHWRYSRRRIRDGKRYRVSFIARLASNSEGGGEFEAWYGTPQEAIPYAVEISNEISNEVTVLDTLDYVAIGRGLGLRYYVFRSGEMVESNSPDFQ